MQFLQIIILLYGQKISKARYPKGVFLYHKDKDSDKGFILINAGKHLYKLNSINGNLVKELGDGGLVEVGNVLIPPVVYKNQIIVSNMNKKRPIDLISGKINYTITGKKEKVIMVILNQIHGVVLRWMIKMEYILLLPAIHNLL